MSTTTMIGISLILASAALLFWVHAGEQKGVATTKNKVSNWFSELWVDVLAILRGLSPIIIVISLFIFAFWALADFPTRSLRDVGTTRNHLVVMPPPGDAKLIENRR